MVQANWSFAQKGPPDPPPGGGWGNGNGNGGGPGCWPPPCIPINGGIEYLLVAGVLLGAYTLRKKKEDDGLIMKRNAENK